VIYLLATRQLAFPAIWQQVLTLVPVAIGLGWCLANRMGEGAGSHLTIGWLYDARHAPIVTLILSLGGLLLPALIGCRRWPTLPLRTAFPALPGIAIGLCLLYLVTLTDRSWVGFRAGNILQVCLPLLVARGFAGLADAAGRGAAWTLVGALLVVGSPTTVIDTYNAQDITNLRMGPGFPWTITLSPAQQAGFEWIRQSTWPTAVVQADPVVRVRKNWSVIPTFAGRRMAAGEVLALLPEPEHAGMTARVHALFTSLDADTAHSEARTLGIDYVWIDGDDGPDGNSAIQRFQARPDLFTPEFTRGRVAIFRVK
jgi:hypothetical protein